MNALKFLEMAVIAIFLCTGLAACGGDNDDFVEYIEPDGNNGNNGDGDDGDEGNEGTITVINLEKAGTLDSLLGDEIWETTSLKLSGPLNGDDIYCLRQMCGESSKGVLETLDLEDASIIEGGMAYITWGALHFYTSRDKIGEMMFINCSVLETIVLPKNVTSIEQRAFFECRGLISVTLNEELQEIGSYAFDRCSSLVDVVIPEGVTSIGGYAFEYCSSLTNVVLPNTISVIYYNTFLGCSALQSIVIPDNVTGIGPCAFQNCSALQSIVIPDNVTDMGNGVGLGSDSSPGVFKGCKSLTDVTIGTGLTYIPEETFQNCTSLQTITLPKNIAIIEEDAFCGCTRLNELYCYATTPPSINNSFDKPNTFIYVPKGCLEAYQTSQWGSYFSYIYEMEE